MRYMAFVKMREDVGQAPPALFAAIEAEMRQAFADGSMIDAGGLGPGADSGHLSLRGGEILTTDGPWAEAKEVAGGYSIIEARSYEEALASARRVLELHREHWPGWEGSVEVRPISGGPDS